MTETGWHLWHLRAGDKIRVSEGQPIRVVTRVTTGAAYYEVITENTYKVFDTKTGLDQEVTRKDRKTMYISAYSYVEMIERGPAKPVKEAVVVDTLIKVTTPRPELPPIEYRKSRKGKR